MFEFSNVIQHYLKENYVKIKAEKKKSFEDYTKVK